MKLGIYRVSVRLMEKPIPHKGTAMKINIRIQIPAALLKEGRAFRLLMTSSLTLALFPDRMSLLIKMWANTSMMIKSITRTTPSNRNTGKRQLRMKSLRLALVKAEPDELMTRLISDLTMKTGITNVIVANIWKLHISGRD